MGLEELLDRAARSVAKELGVEFVSILELDAEGEELELRASYGWPDGAVEGNRTVPATLDSIQGFTLAQRGPVVSEDLGAETRFRASGLQEAAGVESAMAVHVGRRDHPYGVLGAHSLTPHRFSGDDAHFLQAIANVLGAAVERGRAETLFRDLADTTPALMWTTDAEGRVTFVNQGWLRFTGRTLEEELGHTFGMSAHPDDRPRLERAWTIALSGREPFRVEYRLRTDDGSYRWVLEQGVPRTLHGEFAGYVGTATDIDDRRSMEDALRESEARFRDLADTAPVMIWTTDDRGRVTFVNARWLDFTGTSLEEEVGDSFGFGVHPEDVDVVLESWGVALSERRRWEREYRLRSRDGSYRWIVDRGLPRYEDGVFRGYVGTAVDIHSRKLMETELRRVYEREHTIAETLQRSLLPARLPHIEGMAMAARYLPAAEGAAIGGDWYDAVELSDGRVALVVGDVVGHGLRAAAAMGQLRNAFRAYALAGSPPANVMAAVNRLVTAGGEDVMATVVYLVLDRDTGEVTFTSAGHPPPLVLSPQGPTFLEGGRSVPVGATDTPTFREARSTLPAGSTLLLYTDGLVERRDEPLAERLDALLAGAAEMELDVRLDDLCDRVLAGAFGAVQPADDVAVLAVRPEAVTTARLALSLPADPEVLAQLRRRLARFLHAAGASADEQYEIALTVSEAAGNAIEHAYGPGDAHFEVEVVLEDGVVVASVRDAGNWRPRRGEERGRGLTLIEGLMDDAEVIRGEHGTIVTMRRQLNPGAA